MIMELLRRQLLSPRYIQHSARVLFLIAEASERERAEILDAIFDDKVANEHARRARDYVYDIR
jgi:malate synthase